jgi:alpha,alpha-trehalase
MNVGMRRACICDYDFVNKKQFPFEAATIFFPRLECAANIRLKLVEVALPQFIKAGGITGSTKASIAGIPEDVPQRQWDYPGRLIKCCYGKV